MLSQSLHQKLLQKLSPQQIQLMKLLQVPTIALEQRIKEELQENPALEEGAEDEEFEDQNQDEFSDDDTDGDREEVEDTGPSDSQDFIDLDDYITDEDVPYYKLNSNNKGDEEKTEMPIVVSKTFHDLMFAQLDTCGLNDRDYMIAEYLLGNIDDDGYLRRPIRSIVDDLAFSQNVICTENEMIAILKTIQTFDPAGVGARDLQECLLIQLNRKNQAHQTIQIAKSVIKNYMEEFSKKHYDKIAKHLGLDENTLKEVIHEILRLNPRPGDSMQESQKSEVHIVPDFIIFNNEGSLELTLNSKNAPDLRISRTYINMLEDYSRERARKDKSMKEAAMFVKQKIEAAKWFIDAISQRQQTLYTTMSAIMHFQHEYFLEGDETKLKPMILKDIADRIGLDISTVSRVANSKYVQTPFGTFLLKSFFSEGLQTESGEEVSSREVKKILTDCIAVENKKKPITDDALAKILKEKGYAIARRTVAKYREQLNIPVARLRKEL
jgi:RNA polymerase sigma-54 factor